MLGRRDGTGDEGRKSRADHLRVSFRFRTDTAAKDPNEMDDEDELDIEKEEQFEIGNRNRALWKKIGRSVASNVRFVSCLSLPPFRVVFLSSI